ncbi:hypothetical protein [Hymenobacter lucidus]|uniref:Lipoprotein n=1 Tax=Hymenobacter lucidus TaxID=2880930 RepID=A0ABS8AR61_9BACT|nr:hypothetical protein [Hymenobacter lucidus]MCB2408702.1 hypothetical protein [Hymenobacter lucidus]
MKPFLYAAALLLVLAGCQHRPDSVAGAAKAKAPACPPTKNMGAIDYKPATYGLYLGQCLDSVQTIVPVHFDHMINREDVDPSSPTDTVLYITIGEDLVKRHDDYAVDADGVLPVLRFWVNGGRVQAFECSIRYGATSASAPDQLPDLRAFTALFTQLQPAQNRLQLAQKHYLATTHDTYQETFTLGIDSMAQADFRYRATATP